VWAGNKEEDGFPWTVAQLSAIETLGVRLRDPHWDAIDTSAIRSIWQCSSGVDRFLMQNRVGKLTPRDVSIQLYNSATMT